MFKFRILTSCVALAALVSPSVAIGAQDNGKPTVVTAPTDAFREYRSIAVSYADLNLRGDDGVERLNTRVRRAAQAVCGMDNSTVQLGMRIAVINCFRGSFERASNDVQIVVTRFRAAPVLAAGSAGTIRVTAR